MKLATLRARLLVPMLSVCVLVMLAAAAGGAALVVRNLTAKFNAQGEHIVNLSADVGLRYIANYYDLTALGNFVKELVRDERVAFAEFLDANGKSLTSDAMKAPADLSGLVVLEREMKDSAGKPVGRVRMGFRDDTGEVRNVVLGVIGASMLLVLAVVVGLQLWSVRHVMGAIGAEPQDAVAVADGIAAGDLTRQVRVAAADATSMMSALARMQGQLRGIVDEIRHASGAIRVASAEISQGHADLSTRTEEQASSLEQTAAAMEEMTATVSQNAENAKKANELAGGTSEVAARGGRAVEDVVRTMTGISESSKKIADIIGVIDGIAFQTNILALNAAVEAARAGEQGRGFAVVAAEVRSLAQRSAEAAKEIRQLITDSVGRIDAGSRQVEQAGATMAEIVASVERVTNLVAEISAASQEQSQSLTQVSDTVQQLEKVTQQNAAMVEQATAASASMDEQAKVLIHAVGTFKLGGDRGAAAQAAPAPAAPARAAPEAAAPKAAVLPVREKRKPAAAVLKPPGARSAEGKRGEEGWEEF